MSGKKSSHETKCSPLAKEQLDKCDTEDHSISSKHKDRSRSDKSSRGSSDKESSSIAHKCTSSAECLQKGPHVDDSSCASGESSHTSHQSPSRSISELKDHGSFTVPSTSSTPHKLGTQPCCHSSSTDSKHFMMPLDMGLYSSFSYYGPPGFGRGGNTPVASVAGLQHISSSMWQPPGLTSLHLPFTTKTLNAEQSTKIYYLVAECQVLGTELAKQFQTLSGLEAMHRTMTQATADETINVEHMAQNVAYSILPHGQALDKKHEGILQQLNMEADKAWKDTNNVVFNHQLQYDVQLVAFISNAKRTVQEKWDEVWECIHRLADVADIPHEACLGLILQVLNKLPTIPMDLSYHMPIPMMLAYGLESYTFQTWCEDGEETSSLGKKARASCLLKRKLKQLANGGRIEDSSLDRSASLAHSAGSAVPGSMGCSPSSSHSQSRSPSQWCKRSGSQSSSTSSIYS